MKTLAAVVALALSACSGNVSQTDGNCGRYADGSQVLPGAYRCIGNKVEICIVADKLSDPPVWEVVQNCTDATQSGPGGACVLSGSGAFCAH